MNAQRRPDYNSLETNIIDVIKEEQIKLGYQQETIRLYYPMESINNLLEVSLPMNELKIVIDNFCSYVKERLGEVHYSCDNSRFGIIIPPAGVAYVKDKVNDRSFLREFIEKIREPECKFTAILSVFMKYSDKVITKEITNGEFDYLIYFEDGIPDAYRYCIKFEDCHTVYHRFTKSDYDNFEF